jgi:uncharacterized membrane protein YqjE
MSEAPEGGPTSSLRALGADLLTLARARLELLGVELRQESERQKALLSLALVATLFLAAGFFALAVLVVVVFWDTHRVASLAVVCAAYIGVGGWAFARLRAILRDRPPPLGATIAEFQRDLDMLKGGE